jgi:hypothetical protein
VVVADELQRIGDAVDQVLIRSLAFSRSLLFPERRCAMTLKASDEVNQGRDRTSFQITI